MVDEVKVNAKGLASIFGAFLITGCAHFSQETEAASVLFNPVVNANALEVSVMSNGCTQATDFYLRVQDDFIELRRTKTDLCRKAPELIRLSFRYDFGKSTYRFKNEVRFADRFNRR